MKICIGEGNGESIKEVIEIIQSEEQREKNLHLQKHICKTLQFDLTIRYLRSSANPKLDRYKEATFSHLLAKSSC